MAVALLLVVLSRTSPPHTAPPHTAPPHSQRGRLSGVEAQLEGMRAELQSSQISKEEEESRVRAAQMLVM